MTYSIRVQCQSSKGLGTFIASDDDKSHAISPVFDGLHELYPWMRANGWRNADGVAGRPWAVEPVTNWEVVPA